MKLTDRLLLAVLIVVVDLVAFVVPLTALCVAYVIAVRPRWFYDWVVRLYGDADGR